MLKGHRGAILYAAFDASGRRAITASEDGTTRIWQVATGTTLQILSGHEAPVMSAALTDDGKYAATASADRTVRLWKSGVATPIAIYRGHLASVQLVRFIPNSSGLISAADDGEVHRWGFVDQYSSMLERAHSAAPRCLSQQQLDQFGLALRPPKWCSGVSLPADSVGARE